MGKKHQRIFHIDRKPRARGGVVVVAMPGIPQCGYTGKPDEEDVVFRYLVPDNGTISGLIIFIEELNVEKAMLDFLSTFGNDEVKVGFPVKVGLNKDYADNDFEVVRGDRLKLKLADSPEVEMTGIWVSFVFKPRGDSKHITRVGEEK